MMHTVSATTFTNDIDNQNTANYKYDKTGNLIEDVSESTRIHWTYYNKVKQIDSVKLTPPKYGLVWATKLRMKYDALGNRVVKENPKHKIKEVYVRDAQGNILALYQVKNDSLYTKEFYMYGSQRLGYFEDEVFLGRKCIGKFCNTIANPVNPMSFIGTQKTLPTLPPVVIQPISSSSVGIVFGKKRYELSDWLGNVRVVINDRKTPVNIGTTTVGYKAQVINVNDYYSYGSTINERTYDYSSTKFRFAFNGKELDNEVYGFGNFQDYGARMYNTRLGRFISTDPIIITEKKYPWYSSYQFAGNKPINYIDLDGKEEAKFDYPWSPQFIGGQNMDEADKRTYFNSMMSTVASGLLLFNPIEDAAIGFMAAKSLDFLKLVGKSINYAIRYENVVIKTAESVNQEFRFARGIGKSKETYDAYKKGTKVIEFTTRKEEKFVRVFKEGKNKMKGRWLTKESEIEGLSPEQIKDKFSLEYVPDKVVDVTVPAGTRIQEGIVSEVEKLGTKGGGRQYKIKSEKDVKYENVRELK